MTYHIHRLPAIFHPSLRALGTWILRSVRKLVILTAILVATRLACEAAWWWWWCSSPSPPPSSSCTYHFSTAVQPPQPLAAAWAPLLLLAAARQARRRWWPRPTCAAAYAVVTNPRNYTGAGAGQVAPVHAGACRVDAVGAGPRPLRPRYRVTVDQEWVRIADTVVVEFDQRAGAWQEVRSERGKREDVERPVVELDQNWWDSCDLGESAAGRGIKSEDT